MLISNCANVPFTIQAVPPHGRDKGVPHHGSSAQVSGSGGLYMRSEHAVQFRRSNAALPVACGQATDDENVLPAIVR